MHLSWRSLCTFRAHRHPAITDQLGEGDDHRVHGGIASHPRTGFQLGRGGTDDREVEAPAGRLWIVVLWTAGRRRRRKNHRSGVALRPPALDTIGSGVASVVGPCSRDRRKRCTGPSTPRPRSRAPTPRSSPPSGGRSSRSRRACGASSTWRCAPRVAFAEHRWTEARLKPSALAGPRGGWTCRGPFGTLTTGPPSSVRCYNVG